MVVCGLKITHDGGIALIDDGRLVFSIEAEKLDNAERHTTFRDLNEALRVLRSFGYRLSDVDQVCIDGWSPIDRILKWNGHDVSIKVAPYRRGLVSGDPMQEYAYSVCDLPYRSYPHYTGHVLSGYCFSPFAARGESSFVLAWDGTMFPYLYFVDREANQVKPIGVLFNLIGNAYQIVAHRYQPFDGPIDDWRRLFSLPGKVMAFVARGQVREEIVQEFEGLYQEACAVAFEGRASLDDDEYTELVGRRIHDLMSRTLPSPGHPHEDALASWQAFVERLLVRSLGQILDRTDRAWPRNLILVGGCALNIKWNRAIRTSGLVEEVWVPPFPNDSGAAIGAACCGWVARKGLTPIQWSVYSGPALGLGQVDPEWASRPCTVAQLAAVLHESEEPVVFLSGRAELGPRALGARSILASPRRGAMKNLLNTIKGREDYRPVAPVCLEHRAREVFDPGDRDPYMLFDHVVRRDWASRVPAICHEDGTARVQTVSAADHPVLFELLLEYERRSGVPVLCNTSANWPGKGFFPDVASAVAWGKAPSVWADGKLYARSRSLEA